MTRLRLLQAINAAELAGFRHYAAALLAMYRREFPATGHRHRFSDLTRRHTVNLTRTTP